MTQGQASRDPDDYMVGDGVPINLANWRDTEPPKHDPPKPYGLGPDMDYERLREHRLGWLWPAL